MAQQALGREDHERLARAAAVAAAVHLAAQQVEILRGRGARCTTSMLFSAQSVRKRSMRALECSGPWPSKPCGSSMTRPLGCPHFASARGDELVDHDLRAVGEIAELRFPDHQRQRIGHAVAELEAQHGVLAERAVENVEARLVGRDVLQRDVALAGFRIVEREVALAECAAAGILAAEPHGRAFEHQGAEGQRFAEGPIDRRRPWRRRRGACPRSRAAWDAGGNSAGKLRDAADDALEHLLIHRGARAEAADLLGRARRSAPAARSARRCSCAAS